MVRANPNPDPNRRWESATEDDAATAFARGFYDALGGQYTPVGRLTKRVSVADAFAAAERAFLQAGRRNPNPNPDPDPDPDPDAKPNPSPNPNQAGHRKGDPESFGRVPMGEVTSVLPPAQGGGGAGAAAPRYGVKLLTRSMRTLFAEGVLTVQQEGTPRVSYSLVGVAPESAEPLAVGKRVHITSFGKDGGVTLEPEVSGVPGCFVGVGHAPSAASPRL